MKESTKRLASNGKVVASFDTADKNSKKITKRQTFDLSFFIGKSYFDDNGFQNYLVFEPVFETFRMSTSDTEIIIIQRIHCTKNEVFH